jgi:hypothetical protein
MSNLTPLEDQLLQILLRGDDKVFAILRKQAKEASVRSRKITGVGFFAEFTVPPQSPRVEGRPTFKFGDVNGTADNVKHGLGFVLYVTDGALSMLEGYTYDESWPHELRGLTLKYSTGKDRDWDALKRIMTA